MQQQPARPAHRTNAHERSPVEEGVLLLRSRAPCDRRASRCAHTSTRGLGATPGGGPVSKSAKEDKELPMASATPQSTPSTRFRATSTGRCQSTLPMRSPTDSLVLTRAKVMQSTPSFQTYLSLTRRPVRWRSSTEEPTSTHRMAPRRFTASFAG